MITTARKLMIKVVYLFLYGPTGCGKTCLALTLDPDGTAYITAETRGPTSAVNMMEDKDPNWNGDFIVCVVPSKGDPFKAILAYLEQLRRNPKVTVVVLDGLSGICDRAVDHAETVIGEGTMTWQEWGWVLKGFKRIERACERIVRGDKDAGIPPKSVIMTAWEKEPKREADPFDPKEQNVVEPARPWLQGEAKNWLPGNCDILGRMRGYKKSVQVKVKKDGKVRLVTKRKFVAEIYAYPSEDFIAKTRWTMLPDPCPADLKLILGMVNSRRGSKKETDS